MDEILSRTWEQLVGRFDGPLFFRFIFQPIVAALLGVRAGLADARAHKAPYLWTVFARPTERPNLLRDGWKDVGKVFVLASVLDVVYQLLVIRWVYPGQALLVAVVLALVPYALTRGPVTRLAQKRESQPA